MFGAGALTPGPVCLWRRAAGRALGGGGEDSGLTTAVELNQTVLEALPKVGEDVGVVNSRMVYLVVLAACASGALNLGEGDFTAPAK